MKNFDAVVFTFVFSYSNKHNKMYLYDHLFLLNILIDCKVWFKMKEIILAFKAYIESLLSLGKSILSP